MKRFSIKIFLLAALILVMSPPACAESWAITNNGLALSDDDSPAGDFDDSLADDEYDYPSDDDDLDFFPNYDPYLEESLGGTGVIDSPEEAKKVVKWCEKDSDRVRYGSESIILPGYERCGELKVNKACAPGGSRYFGPGDNLPSVQADCSTGKIIVVGEKREGEDSIELSPALIEEPDDDFDQTEPETYMSKHFDRALFNFPVLAVIDSALSGKFGSVGTLIYPIQGIGFKTKKHPTIVRQFLLDLPKNERKALEALLKATPAQSTSSSTESRVEGLSKEPMEKAAKKAEKVVEPASSKPKPTKRRKPMFQTGF